MDWGGRNEAVVTQFVAWTLMCASEEGAKEYGEKLSNYGKEILFFLLFGKEDYRNKLDNWSVKSIKNWREWQRVDILAEITLSNKESEEKYALFIEVKAYSRTSEKQLKSYREACERYDYESKGFKEKFVVLGAWDDTCADADKECCDAYEFSICTFQDIVENIFSEDGVNFVSSGNCLFDEFWVGKW